MKTIKSRTIIVLALFSIGLIGIFFLVYLNRTQDTKSLSPFSYIVDQDETCSEIAQALGVSVISIVEVNNLKFDCSDIYAGQTLLIPYPTPTVTSSGFVFASPTPYLITDCETVSYPVKGGDTLESISREYNIPAKALIDYNGIIDEKIVLSQGNILVIPLCYHTSGHIDPTALYSPEPIIIDSATPCREIQLKVLQGDTLENISQNYAIPIEYIKRYNHLNTDKLLPGAILLIQICRIE